ncbi:hypothetical protein [Povalibacter sp.]|uniref:hypothetical protein n=1 Tax=Povalibacter sp. TaxID=1962978 RepID=UPI002F42E0E2
MTASGPFTFAPRLASGTAYAVTVLTQPAGQACAVSSGTGTITSANVANAAINCTSTGGGGFSAGSGTIATADVTNIAVNCTGFTIAGSVTGLTGSGLVVQLNGGNDLAVAGGSTSFTFPATASLGATIVYTLHIQAQPAGQTCTIVRAVGFVTPAAPNVNTAAIACTNNAFNPLAGTYQLTAVDGVALPERGFLTFYRDGTYIFAFHADDSDCDANNGNGLEYGVYRWNSTTNAFAFVTTALDTNGDCGVADGNARLQGTIVKNANGTLAADFLDNNSGDHILVTLTPVASVTGTLIGSWGNNQVFTTFDDNGHLFSADTRWPVQIAATAPGIGGYIYMCERDRRRTPAMRVQLDIGGCPGIPAPPGRSGQCSVQNRFALNE